MSTDPGRWWRIWRLGVEMAEGLCFNSRDLPVDSATGGSSLGTAVRKVQWPGGVNVVLRAPLFAVVCLLIQYFVL
jgi:hypothetical protein